MNTDAIPAALKRRPQWVVWKVEERDGRNTKSPWQVADPSKRASSTDAATWGTFAFAVSALDVEGVAGIGYVFSADDPFVGVDIDEGCADKRAIMDALASYTEVSPSGNGFHVIVRAEIDQGRHPEGIGIFAQGRYFTMTGDRVTDYPETVEWRHDELQAVIEAHLPQKERRTVTMPAVLLELDDHELVERARNARNGPKFRALYDDGDVSAYASPSEADLALCDLLAFWTGPNPSQIDRLFRSSRLMRDKWDREDYAVRTITEAIEGHAGAFWEPRPTPAERMRRSQEPDGESEAEQTPHALIVTQWKAFSDVHEPGPNNLLGDDDTCLLPADGTLVFFGEGGAGKTTIEVDVLCHLAAGDDWLGLPCHDALRILAIENEGPRRMFRRKLKGKLRDWPGTTIDTERMWILEEPWGVASLREPRFLNALAERIVELEVDVLAAGPVNRLGIRGGGTPEEVNEFMAYVDALRQLVPNPLAVVFAHHTNKAGTVSGAWEGAPDSLVHVKAVGHGVTKVIWQKVRWGSELHGRTWDLAWRDGSTYERLEAPEPVSDEQIAEGILRAVEAMPEQSWRDQRTHEDVVGRTEDLARLRDAMIADGRLVNLGTPKRFKLVPGGSRGSRGSLALDQGLFDAGTDPLGTGADSGSRPLSPEGGGPEPEPDPGGAGQSDELWDNDDDPGF